LTTKVLIIGSKGFIGSHAFKYFSSLQDEFECWGCDVVQDYAIEKYFVLDVTNSDYNEAFQQVSFDFCINCSGAASVPDSIIHPMRDFSLNVFNVVKILDAIHKYAPGCKFINLSSAAVYGNPEQLPIKETDACKPLSPYGEHKLIAENVCYQYYKYFGLKTCSVRIFSAYGPGLKKQLLWDVFQKSKKNDTLTLFGTGNESRDFIFIEDIIQALLILIEKGDFKSDVFNLANGIEVTIREVAEHFLNQIKYKGSLLFTGETRAGDPANWRADIQKISMKGFNPQTGLKEGITKYIQWLREEESH
jgi:dTDP-glucose 4,6-dehydratase/UDP-glucose 4-epimerase